MTIRLSDLPMSDDTRRRNADLLQREGSRPIEHRARPERLLNLDDGFDSDLERDFYVELRARGYLKVMRCNKKDSGWTIHLPGSVDYTPDFIAWHEFQNDVRVYEVKGSDEQKNARDSRTRFRIAAGLFPCFVWVWVTRTQAGRWIEKEYRA
jgi:hypothetical protein